MITQTTLQNSSYSIKSDGSQIELIRQWQDSECQLFVRNDSDTSVKLEEVVVFDFEMPYPAITAFYGEGYNKLSQYKGTISSFENITNYSDYKHYKLEQQEGFFTVYNLLMLFPANSEINLMAFSSCHRFSGEFRFNHSQIEVVLDCEGVDIAPGETLELEKFFFESGDCREKLLENLSNKINSNHKRLDYPSPPTGWCSWYCYGPNVTEQDVFDNLDKIKSDFPELEFIQLDDGYQNKMGDWLDPHPNFPNGVKSLCLKIKDAGFEPAIWVAPFIAEENSKLFQEHPDWFIKDSDGKPLSSSKVSFGGWRCAPWYMLDGTHPQAQDYLKHVFRTMREEWKCKYFKLDANMWGALPFGKRHLENSTKIDAYRAGMRAIREGAGEDSFILGCNAPMWPSIGEVHGMRITGDISRKWKVFKVLAEECFNRNWQNNIWYNDPDCVVLENLAIKVIGPDGKPFVNNTEITEDEFSFHAAHMLASGGMILSSDKMMELSQAKKQILKKLLQSKGIAAKFDDKSFKIGRIPTQTGSLICLFNWNDYESKYSVTLNAKCNIMDYWTDELIAKNTGITPVITLPPHSGRVLVCDTI